jgi:hypothetical protein
MPKQVRFRRGTTSQHSAFTGADGEVTIDTTRRCLVIHDGVTAGGKPVFGFLALNPPSVITIQTLAGALRITGGDAETFALEVAAPVKFNDLWADGFVQLKRVAFLQEFLTFASNITLNLGTFHGKRIALTGNVTFSATGHFIGAEPIMRVVCDATLRTLGWPSAWKWVGSTPPANIAANKTALLQLWSFGTTDPDIVARWLVEP